MNRFSIRHVLSCAFVFSLLLTAAFEAQAQTSVGAKYGLIPSSPLLSRLTETPPSVMQQFRDSGMSPVPHQLTIHEQEKVKKAFAALPPLPRRILQQHLRSISFLDSMPNTALTSIVNYGDSFPLFDLTIRAAILTQTVSQWATEKKQTCFMADDSTISVSVDAGNFDAILYVLLHESTHIVDASLHITPQYFSTGIWLDRTTLAAMYKDTLLQSIRFRPGGAPLPVDEAQSVYKALMKTPFASLYGSSSYPEDLAEYVSVFHFTRKIHQPFRIVIEKNRKPFFSYEPMNSRRVQQRMPEMKRFYK